MKKITLFLAGIYLFVSGYCQNAEFTVYSNGLIYNEQTMSRLSHIVDSLNLKYKMCDFDKVFYAPSQTTGVIVTLKKGNVMQAKKDMEDNIPFADFVSKYPDATIQRDVLIVKSRYKNYDEEEVVEIGHFDLKSDYGFSIELKDVALYEKDLKNEWLCDYQEKSSYSEEYLQAFYFPNNFSSPPIPAKYCRMIGYSDCLIDTTVAKFKDNLENGRVELPSNWQTLSQKKQRQLLDKMRSTRVVGYCSQDNSPRVHAVNIALLSAETANWEVFLKSHLDIMNDRFERMSDGSYAWGARNTYIKELEELNINVIDLILGISLRVENPATNHYYGSIGRIGRALSETKNRAEVETAILSAIADTQLDYYNRLLFYFLFKNYNYYINDETIKKENATRLSNAAATLPGYFSERLAGK